MAAKQPPSFYGARCNAAATLALLLAVISFALPGVRTQATQNAGSQGQPAPGDTHGLFNVYFIPAYRISTNRTLKAPSASAAIVFRPGSTSSNRQKTSTTERPGRISGAASDILAGQQSLPPAANQPGISHPSQFSSLPIRTQASAITQYLLGYTNGYQANAHQQKQQQQQPRPQYYPIPTGYYPYPTQAAAANQYPPPNQIPAYYPYPSVYIPPSIIPKSASVPPQLPPINSNVGRYSAAASSKDESVVKSSQIMVTPVLATAGPIYATAADEIQTTIEPAPKSTLPDSTITASENTAPTTLSNKSTTASLETPSSQKTTSATSSTSTSQSPSTTSTSTPPPTTEGRTSPSSSSPKLASQSSSSAKAQEEEHRSISRHFEFSEDKERSQVNATGDIRLTASRKTSSDGESSQQKAPPAAPPLAPAFPTLLPALPLNTPHPHSHPHPALIQGPNGFYIGTYNPANHVGVIPPPTNDPYAAYNPFGPAALNQGGGFGIQPTLPPRYEDLYYGFAPGYPFGVSPNENNASRLENPANNAAPRPPPPPPPPPPQQAQQGLPPNQQLPVYPGPPRQYFDVAGPHPYAIPQQVPYAGFGAQPFPTSDYPRFSNEVLQPPVVRPFYPGDDASLANRGFNGDPAAVGIPNRLYNSDPSVAPIPSRLYNPDPGADALLHRGFGGGPPFFARSDNAEANSGLSNFASPVRGVDGSFDVNSRSDNTLDNYSRGLSRDSSEVGGGLRDY